MIDLRHGDALEVLRTLPDASVHAVVTDPPYGLKFMGAKWDTGAVAFSVDFWREVLRVAKPGAHLLAFGGTRTYHRMTCAIEDAGWEIRDSLHWVYGQGFPKSLDVSKAIDSALGAKRARESGFVELDGPEPATATATAWKGYGTALKPSHEPIVLARKPLDGTVAANVQKHGTGGLNVDACRVENADAVQGRCSRDGEPSAAARYVDRGVTNFAALPGPRGGAPEGRWPPNAVFSGDAIEELDRQSGERLCGSRAAGVRKGLGFQGANGDGGPEIEASTGGASRFFPCFRYVPKPSRSERGDFNHHTTVKPVDLMRWLVRLITPHGGTVLDPFCGSGTTAVACIAEGNFDFLGIEQDGGYCEIAIKRAQRESPLFWNAPARKPSSA